MPMEGVPDGFLRDQEVLCSVYLLLMRSIYHETASICFGFFSYLLLKYSRVWGDKPQEKNNLTVNVRLVQCQKSYQSRTVAHICDSFTSNRKCGAETRNCLELEGHLDWTTKYITETRETCLSMLEGETRLLKHVL